MKTALLISGKLGQWKETKESIFEKIIAPFNPDIFLFTWSSEDYKNFISYYKPKSFYILDFEKEKHKLNSKTIPYWPGLKPMTFGMRKVFKLFERHCNLKNQKYDLVIRVRPDLSIIDTIKTHEAKDCAYRDNLRLPFYAGNSIYNHEEELKKQFAFSFVYEKSILPRQINDQIAIGSFNKMKKYMNLFNKVETSVDYLWSNGYPKYMCEIPECILTTALNINNINYCKLSGSSKTGSLRVKLIK